MASNHRASSVVSTIIKIAVTVLVIGYIIRKLGWSRIAETVAKADFGWLGAALVVFLISGALGVVQWRILLKNKGVSLPYGRAFVLYFVGMFFNNFMFGMVAGDAVKVALIRENKGSVLSGFAATFLDRFAGLWSMMGFAMLGGAVLLWRGFLYEQRISTALIALLGAFFVFSVTVAFLISQRLQRFTFRLIEFLPIPGKSRIMAIIREVILETHDRHILLPIVCISAVVQFMRISVHILCAAALGLLTAANYQYFFIFVPVLAVMMLLPLPFGVKESFGGTLFLLAGFSPDSPAEPLVMEFLASLIGIVASLLGGVLFITSKLKNQEVEITQ